MFGLLPNLSGGFDCRNRIVEASTAESVFHLDSERYSFDHIHNLMREIHVCTISGPRY